MAQSVTTPMPVYLIGFPGCGKTTLGLELARLAGLPFVDLDLLIERQQGRPIVELMPLIGEARFRQLEREALHRVAKDGNRAIVACGGGTPCQPGNMELMNATGATVWLTTTAERIIARLCLPEHRAKRPQIAALSDDEIAAYVHRTLAMRTPHYAKAQRRFDATRIETAAETTATAHLLALNLHLL